MNRRYRIILPGANTGRKNEGLRYPLEHARRERRQAETLPVECVHRRPWTARHAARAACVGGHRGTASRAPGYAVVDSISITLAPRDECQALRALHEHRPRPALSRPRPGRRSGVNADAINITAPYAKRSQSLRCAALGVCTAARPAGSHKGRLCLAPRPTAHSAGVASTA